MTEPAHIPRTLAFVLTHESDPRFRYGQSLILKRGTGKIVGLEYISQDTHKQYLDRDRAPDLGWHYSFGYDKTSPVLDPIELFSEAQLLQSIT